MSGAHRRYGGRDDADDGDDPALTEVRLAHRVEDRLTKDEILARYLDLVYFGRGAYGVEAAARTWFGTSAAALTAPQAALLAGMMRARDLRPPPEGCTGARPGTGFLCREVVDRLAAVVAPGRDRRPVLALAAKRTYRNDAAAGETALPLGGSVPAATWFDLMSRRTPPPAPIPETTGQSVDRADDAAGTWESSATVVSPRDGSISCWSSSPEPSAGSPWADVSVLSVAVPSGAATVA